MFVCKRSAVFFCRVTALDASTGGVWLADRDTGEPRGKMPLRGNKFELVRQSERMTTAPAMPDFAKTVNAVVIRSTAGFEHPVIKANKIKALASLKKSERIY